MYAIVETGGKQYRVALGDTLAVERLDGEPGETIDLDRVLLLAGNADGQTRVGAPGVAGAIVRAEVVEHIRGEKIIVFRYKSKVRYRRKTGHRQSLTRLRITDILLDGASTAPAAPAAAAPTRRSRSATPEAPAGPAAETAAQQFEEVAAEARAEHAPEGESTASTPRRRRAASAAASTEEEMPTSAGEAGPEPEADTETTPTASEDEDTPRKEA